MFTYVAREMLVPLILRLTLAVIFVIHGLSKINPETDWGASWLAKGAEAPPAGLQIAVAYGELLGGIALAVGFLTPLAALGIIAVMVGAIASMHSPRFASTATQHGSDFNFALIAMCLALIFIGPGPLSFDRYMFNRRRN
jgi:putative oxidoreductase